MKRLRYFFLIFSICASIGIPYAVYGATIPVTPEVYKVTINKVEIHNSTTDTWVTIGQGDKTFDIASVSAGASVGGYISGKAIPAGTYDKVRVTVSRHMYIKIHYSSGGTDYYTTSTSTYLSNIDVTVVQASTNASDYAEGEVVSPESSNGIHYNVIGDYFTDTQTLSTPFTIKKGSSGTLKVAFDVTNSCTLYDGNSPPSWGSNAFFYPGAPVVSVTLN